jgi:hypothetical protein
VLPSPLEVDCPPLEIDASRVGFIGSPLLFSMDVVSIDGGWDDKTVEEDTAGKTVACAAVDIWTPLDVGLQPSFNEVDKTT